MFGKRYCTICGVKIEKTADYERFGRHFCSEDHAQEYVQSVQRSQTAAVDRSQLQRAGGCG